MTKNSSLAAGKQSLTALPAATLVCAAGFGCAAALAACRSGAPATPAESPTAAATAEATEDTRIKISLNTPTPDPAWPVTYHALTYDPVEKDTLWMTFGPGLVTNTSRGAGEWIGVETSNTGGAPLYAMAFPAGDALLTGGREIFRVSHDRGDTWQLVAGLGDASIMGMTVIPGPKQTVVVLVDGEGVLGSEDNGVTWAPAGPLPNDGVLPFGLWVVPDEDGRLLGRSGLRLLTFDRAKHELLEMLDGGTASVGTQRWKRLAAAVPGDGGLDGDVFGIAVTPDGTAFAATEAGLFVSTDGGDTWEVRGKLPALVAVAVAPDNAEEITAIDNHGRVFQSTDGGNTW